MKILGLSFGYHDAAAALVQDGVILAAAQAERFSRKKHDERFPAQAIDFCLDSAGLEARNLDAVVYYENTALKWDRIVSSYLDEIDKQPQYLERVIGSWIYNSKFDPEYQIADYLGLPIERIAALSHHQSHAASAYYCSPFAEAAVVTLDGVGEYETMTVSIGNESGIEKLSFQSFPHSVGLLYSAITAYLGFEVNEGEYKVMGMIRYGKP